MAELRCDKCGELNPPGTEFCLSCNTFLAWDRTTTWTTREPPTPRPSERTRPDPLRVTVDRSALTLTPGGVPEDLVLTVYNASRIVERYAADLPDAPGWLAVVTDELRLNPQHSGEIRVMASIPAPPLIAAGDHRLTLRVRSGTDPEIGWSTPLELTVGVVDAPVIAELEPEQIRVVDGTQGTARLRLDNRNANRAITFDLSARDAEDALRFGFEPARVQLAPMGTASALIRITGPTPTPGQELRHRFTVIGTTRERPSPTQVTGTLLQTGTTRELKLAVEPARVSISDAGEADFRLVLQLAGGHQPIRVALRGGDRDGLVQVTFQPSGDIELPVASTGRIRMNVQAPPPDPGQEIAREIQVVATAEGGLSASATATLVQRSSPDALKVRLEPVVLRVQDTATARTRLIADNRQGTRPAQLALIGRDPELALGFRFSPPVLQVPAGSMATVAVELTGPEPAPGKEITRTFTITSADESVELVGTLVQTTTSRELRVQAEPARQTVTDLGEANFRISVEQPGGQRVGRVSFRATDSDGQVQVAFHPPVIDVPAESVGRVRMNVRAPIPGPGQETTREITVTATSGDGAKATGQVTLVQRGSAPALRLRLEPELVRVRDAGGGRTRLVADNRQGDRPAQLRLTARDPELALRFQFSQQILQVPARETASVWVDLTGRPPEPGGEVSRTFTIDPGSDQIAAVSGTFVQTTSAPAISRLAVHLEPAAYRLGTARTGSVVVVADNRGGSAPVTVTWRGSDPDGLVQFGFDPPSVTVPAGGTATSRVGLTLPPLPPGTERTTAITVSGTDGRLTVVATGSVLHSGGERETPPPPVVRSPRDWGFPLALAGAALMVVGIFLPWLPDSNGFDLPLSAMARHFDLNELAEKLAEVESKAGKVVSVGAAMLLLAVLLVIGILRRNRPASAVFALLGLILAVATAIPVMGDGGTAVGELVAGAGGLVGVTGGLGMRRSPA